MMNGIRQELIGSPRSEGCQPSVRSWSGTPCWRLGSAVERVSSSAWEGQVQDGACRVGAERGGGTR